MTGGKTASPRPNEFHYRCDYLYKAASLLSSPLESSGIRGLEVLSKLYLQEMKELCLVEMVQLEKDFARVMCKCCKNVFVPRCSGKQSMSLRLDKRKQLILVCLSCGTKKQYLRSSEYLSRSERNQQKQHTTASKEV